MEYQIKSEKLHVKISSLGGELISVKKEGRETLWQNQTGDWKGHAPILFPICGHFGVAVDGVVYPMELHGVARKSEFLMVEQSENKIRLLLTDNENTRRVYPYAFRFFVEYEVAGERLFVRFTVENPSDTPLFYSVGAHESFLLEGDVDGYQLHFEEEEDFIHMPHNGGGYLTGERVCLGKGRIFPIPKEMLLASNTIIFEKIRSNTLWLEKRSGERVVEITKENFPHLLLWRPSGRANMICIEPWLNLPDVEKEDYKEFSKKKGIQTLLPHKSHTYCRTITYTL